MFGFVDGVVDLIFFLGLGKRYLILFEAESRCIVFAVGVKDRENGKMFEGRRAK